MMFGFGFPHKEQLITYIVLKMKCLFFVAKLLHQEDNPIIITHRKHEISAKKKEIKWRPQPLKEAVVLPGK